MNTNDTNVETIPSTPKPQTSRKAIQANVELLVEQLEAGHSDALTAYLIAMGRFHRYSFGNILLEIARQRSDATRASGMYAWNQFTCPRCIAARSGCRLTRQCGAYYGLWLGLGG